MYNAKSQNPINDAIINSVYVRFVTPRVRTLLSYYYSYL